MKSALLFLVLFGGLANLTTCGDARPVVVEAPVLPKMPEHVTPAKVGETTTETALRQARDLAANLRGKLAESDARVAALVKDVETEHREAFLGTLRASCLWVAGLALLGALACAVLAFVSPLAKQTLAKVAIACGVLVVLATGTAWAVPWLPSVGVVVLIVLACAIIAGIVYKAVQWWPSFAHASLQAAVGYQEATAIAQSHDLVAVDANDRDNTAAQIAAGPKVLRVGDKLHAAAAAFRARKAAL